MSGNCSCPRGFNLFDLSADPCSGATPARSAADCARSGVTAAQYGTVPDSPAGQYNFLQGGTPSLEPEQADTYSLGVVWRPDFIDGLALTVDYYDVEIEKGISNLEPEFILNQCLDGNDSQCAPTRLSQSPSVVAWGSFLRANTLRSASSS